MSSNFVGGFISTYFLKVLKNFSKQYIAQNVKISFTRRWGPDCKVTWPPILFYFINESYDIHTYCSLLRKQYYLILDTGTTVKVRWDCHG